MNINFSINMPNIQPGEIEDPIKTENRFGRIERVFADAKEDLRTTTLGDITENNIQPLKNAQLFLDKQLIKIKNSYGVNIKIDLTINNSTIFISEKEIKKQCRFALDKVLEDVAKKHGLTIVSHKYLIESAEYSDINSQLRTIISDIKNRNLCSFETDWLISFDCAKYAFYRLKDPSFTNFILGKNGESLSDLRTTLTQKFGYFLVDQPQKDDLIVYINDAKEPQHLGVLEDEKTVHSKWGWGRPQIIANSLNRMLSYGSSFEIYRKGNN